MSNEQKNQKAGNAAENRQAGANTCAACGSAAPLEAAFCPECGNALQTSPGSQSVLATIGGMQTINPTPGGSVPRSMQILERGERVADRYVVKEVIGQGGMGVVYRAHDELTEKTVALKLIHPGRAATEREMKRLKQEGVTARDIRHKFVVSVYDVGQCNGAPFITMEHLKGRSLRQWHRAWQQAGMDVPVELVVRVISQILEGLHAAHERGVVHRDLKPENVMVINETEYDLDIKILDFGIARACEQNHQTSSPMGTRGYMAPEQLTRPDMVGPSADLYALSVMFYELLMDVVPQGHWQPPSGGRGDVPRALDALIERGLSNRPQNRPQSAAEYLKLLDQTAGRYKSRRPDKERRSTAPVAVDIVQPIVTASNREEESDVAGSAASRSVGTNEYPESISPDQGEVPNGTKDAAEANPQHQVVSNDATVTPVAAADGHGHGQLNSQYGASPVHQQMVPPVDYHPGEQFEVSAQPTSNGGMVWGILAVLLLVFIGICGIGIFAAIFDSAASSPESNYESVWDAPEFVEPAFDDPAFFEDPAFFDPGNSGSGFEVPYNGYDDGKWDDSEGKF